MDSYTQVAPGIYQVRQGLKIRRMKTSVSIYVIPGNDGLVFDAGYGRPELLQQTGKAIEQILALEKNNGRPGKINRVMISHGHVDHFSGLTFLKKKFNLEALVTKKHESKIRSKKAYKKRHLDVLKKSAENPFVIWLKSAARNLFLEFFVFLTRMTFYKGPVTIIPEQHQLKINNETWKTFSVPGHNDDDIALYNEDKGILLCGDLIHSDITIWLGPPASDLAVYMDTLESLLKLPKLKLILPAHGRPITNPEKRIHAAISHRNDRTQQIFDILEKAPKGLTFYQIFRTIYPAKALLRKNLFGGWIQVTLDYLCNQGTAVSFVSSRKTFYKLK